MFFGDNLWKVFKFIIKIMLNATKKNRNNLNTEQLDTD